MHHAEASEGLNGRIDFRMVYRRCGGTMPFFFWCFTMSIAGVMERFVPMIMVVETEGMLQVLGTGKDYQQEPFHLKNRNVLAGINHLINALQPCVVEVLLEIVYCNLQRLEQ
jgi:hypothetical protein